MSPALIELVVGGVLLLATTVYGLFRHWWDQQKIATALATTHKMSERQLEQQIKREGAADVTTPKTEIPR